MLALDCGVEKLCCQKKDATIDKRKSGGIIFDGLANLVLAINWN